MTLAGSFATPRSGDGIGEIRVFRRYNKTRHGSFRPNKCRIIIHHVEEIVLTIRDYNSIEERFL